MHTVFKFARWFVLTVSSVLVIYAGWHYLSYNEFPIVGGTEAERELIKISGRNWLADVFAVPRLIAAIFLGFWIQKLFALYATSTFFSKESVRCFVWLVITNTTIFLYAYLVDIFCQIYLKKFDPSYDIVLIVDLSHVFTILVSFALVHALKCAHEIEKENREFV